MLTLIAYFDSLRSLTGAAWKATGARLREIGVGSTYSEWTRRAEICERCPLRVVKCGKSYCGNPLLDQLRRDPARDGCGCPTHAKAKDPAEHCPIDQRLEPAIRNESECNCKWCITEALSRGQADRDST